jgi:PAS domain S-box-containing protein
MRPSSKDSDLRRLAEKKLKGKKKKKPELSVEKAEELIHELQVYQVELEMQNEELRTAQEDLEQSRSRYADLYDFAPVGYFTFDKKGLILDVNLTGAGQLGTERGLLIKKPFSHFIKKEDQDLFYLHRQQVFKTKTRHSCQMRIKRKDGTEFYAHLESMAVTEEKGKIRQFRTTVTDVTERRMAADRIKESEKQYKTLVESISDGVLVLDRKWRYVVVNNVLERITGKTKEELIGNRIMDVFPGFEETAFFKSFQKVMKTGMPDSVTDLFTFADGRQGWYEVREYPLPEGLFITVTDITERKRAEELVRLNEARLKASYELSRMSDATPEEISNFILEQTIRLTKSSLGFLGYMTDDQDTFIINLWSGEAMADCKMIDRPVHFPLQKAGAWAEAIRQRKPIMINNYAENKGFNKGLPAGHVKLTRFISVPVFDGDKIVALAAVANKENDYDASDINQVSLLAKDMWRYKRQREAEDALAKSEERFRELAENIKEVFWLFDCNEQRVLYASPAYEEIWGRSVADLYNRYEDWTDSIHPDDRSFASKSFEEIAQTGGGEDREYRIIRPDGHVRWISDRGFAIYGEDGSVSRIAGIAEDITDHKIAEEKMNEMAKFPSENPYPIMRIAQDGTILYANTASKDLLKVWQSEVGGPLPESYEDLIGDVLKDGTRINVEVKLGPRVVSLSFVPILELGYVNVYGFDITNRKQAEKALLENQHFIQRIADTAPNILYIFDRKESELIYANHMLETQLGYSIEDVRKLGKRMQEELVHPDDLSNWNAHLNSIAQINDGDIASVIFRVKSSQSEWRWLYNRNIVFKRDKDGTVSQVLGAALDITERKEVEDELDRYRKTLEKMVADRTANLIETNEELEQEIASRKIIEKSLRASESEFRTLSHEFHDLLDALPDSIMQLSPDLKVVWANRATASMLGQAVSGIKNTHCFAAWHDRTDPCEQCPAVKSFSTGKTESAFVTSRKGRFFDIKAIPIKDDDEKIHSVMLVTSDVTERNRLQSEALRSAHLASIGELSAGVAHEINNPINGIINYAQILIDRNRKRKDKDLIEDDLARQIIHEGDRISNIVRSLLSFARESKADEREHVNISDVLSDAFALTDALLRKDGITLKVRIPPDIPQVMGNYQQIEQVFLNIINNARYALNEKYAGTHKNKMLEITAEQERMNGDPGVRVTFADTGIGIPSDNLDKVIHPFFTSKPGGKGTGLGLSISHGIVSEHNGRLFFESAEGEFTRVMVDLPANDKKDH